MRGDDFGYIEGVVETIRSGTWTPSDWLDPFNLLLPGISALLYAITDSLWVATSGLVIVLAGLNFVLLGRWLRANGLRDRWAVWLVCLSPVVINKFVEYTGVSLGVTLTLGALLAWHYKRVGLFYVMLLLGVLNRQSIVALLVFPLWEIGQHWRKAELQPVRHWIGVALVCVLVGSLEFGLPENYARSLMRAQLGWSVARDFLPVWGFGLLICLAIRTGWSWLSEGCGVLGENFRANVARPFGSFALSLAAVVIVTWSGQVIRWEAPGVEAWGELLVVITVFGGIWLGQLKDLGRTPVFWVVSVYLALVGLRSQWWDYYFIEPALVLVLNLRSVSTSSRWWVKAPVVIGLTIYVGLFGRLLREVESNMVAYEIAERSGALSIADARQVRLVGSGGSCSNPWLKIRKSRRNHSRFF